MTSRQVHRHPTSGLLRHVVVDEASQVHDVRDLVAVHPRRHHAAVRLEQASHRFVPDCVRVMHQHLVDDGLGLDFVLNRMNNVRNNMAVV